MTPDEIRNTILKAIYSDTELVENLVLKGGNALKLHRIVDRESQDLDFSIKETIRFTKENEGVKLQQLITDAFSQKGFFVNSFEFVPKPKNRHRDLPPYWGGYKISFALLDQEKYQDKINSQDSRQMKELNKYALSIEGGVKKIEIDLSYDEYTEHKEAYDLDGTTIYLYSPLMIVYEKIRASCQQLEEYPLTTNKTRARDLYDIFKILTNINQVELRSEVLSEDNFYILENIFRVKEVPLELMTKLDTKKDDLAADYERKVLPQIPNKEQEEFEYIFDYNQRLFNELFERYQKYNENR
ncbi:TPA: nucleotidyl transferase AbiEii/AbiGii toxin family protein [Streptococcus suis]|nr:nucleotidyl transferase AbiEii/AbiGii toxin family protein [Streptococcus suis]HEM5150416.1 nucleotidyl transferase AbiEii/AbiGii toxin family protein [Streptococcus suis]HEM5227478.1 nucleotidyl transferase AbiEii/AbiGii toxin family protein [Streptococcus suis]